MIVLAGQVGLDKSACRAAGIMSALSIAEYAGSVRLPQADAANQAKTRYISAISHELRTPLNSILGYAQLLEEDASVPAHRRQAITVIRRGGDHLLSLIEGTLDIARIESGKLAFELRPMRFADAKLQQRAAPPLLGQHSSEVLIELGYSAERIDDLQARGVV